MKKMYCLLLAAIFLISNYAFSQLQKGNILIGGDIANFDLGLQKGAVFQMQLDPKLAFFFKNNFALGTYISIDLQSVSKSEKVTYGVGILSRYFIPDKNNVTLMRHSRFFVEATAGLAGSHITGTGNTDGLGVGIGPGYSYFLSHNISLETLLKYYGLIGFGTETYQSDLNLNIGFQIYLDSRRLKKTLSNDTN